MAAWRPRIHTQGRVRAWQYPGVGRPQEYGVLYGKTPMTFRLWLRRGSRHHALPNAPADDSRTYIESLKALPESRRSSYNVTPGEQG